MDASIPLAAAIVVAIFAAGCGYIIGIAFPARIVDRDPDDEPSETIEQRARKHQ
jgi:hypothetical protein